MDTAYPPRKKAVTKTNSYKPRKKASNTPKGKALGSRQAKKNQLVDLLIVGAMIGAGIALLGTVKASPEEAVEPTPQPNSTSAPAGTTVVTRPATGSTAPSAPITSGGSAVTKQTIIYRPAAETTAGGNYTFVDSWNGEGIYVGTSPIYNSLTGNGRNHITQLSNGCFVGLWTGKKQDKMLEMWIKTSAGIEYNYWIAADEVRMFNKAGYDYYMKNGGKGKTSAELNAIINYFRK